jgi:hypothetical protein
VDEAEFQSQFVREGPPTIGDVFARALVPDREDLAAAAADRAEQAATEERRSTLALLNRQHGNPIGELSRATAAAGAARDIVRDLEGQLVDARAVLERAEAARADWAESADRILMAPRAASPDLLAEAKETAARMKVEHDLEVARSQPAPRPKECAGPDCVVCSGYAARGRNVAVNHHPAVAGLADEAVR